MKNNSIILYKSFLGIGKKEAFWLKNEIHADIFPFGNFNDQLFNDYERIIIISHNILGWLPLNSFLQNKWSHIKNKNIIVIAIGKKPDDDPWSLESYNSIPGYIRTNIHFYKLNNKRLYGSSEFKENKELKKSEEDLRKITSKL